MERQKRRESEIELRPLQQCESPALPSTVHIHTSISIITFSFTPLYLGVMDNFFWKRDPRHGGMEGKKKRAGFCDVFGSVVLYIKGNRRCGPCSAVSLGPTQLGLLALGIRSLHKCWRRSKVRQAPPNSTNTRMGREIRRHLSNSFHIT